MKQILETFRAIQAERGRGFLAETGLHCKVGTYKDCAVLKLQKAHWTNDPMNVVPNKSGIFFSIWADPKSLKINRLLYNIHALKLQDLHGYQIKQAIAFARRFRAMFEYFSDVWPNVSLDFGPQTLMQGWIEIKPKTLSADVIILMNHFLKMEHLIDVLLDEMKSV